MAVLISDIDEVKQHVRVTYDDMNECPNFERSTIKYLVPILGTKLLDSLQEAYDGDTTITIQDSLISLCQGVMVPFAYADELSNMLQGISANGLIIPVAENSRTPYKWEFNEMREALLTKGYEAQEALIVFLMEHESDFTDWQDSPYNNPNGFNLIRNGKQLAEVVGIVQPHRCYMQLLPLFKTHAARYIKNALGAEYYDAFSSRVSGGVDALDEYETQLLPIIQECAARKALQFAAVELTMRFSGNGFTVVNNLVDQSEEGRQTAGMDKLGMFKEDCEKLATELMGVAKKLMNENASDTIFPEYYVSSYYTSPDSTTTPPIDNSRYSGFFGN
jgi:hypothetical protein